MKKPLKQRTAEQVEDRTGLLFHLIARAVAGRGGGIVEDEHVDKFVTYCAERILTLYNCNEQVRRKVEGKGNAGRDYCYMIFEHWREGFVKDGFRTPDEVRAARRAA